MTPAASILNEEVQLNNKTKENYSWRKFTIIDSSSEVEFLPMNVNALSQRRRFLKVSYLCVTITKTYSSNGQLLQSAIIA